MRSDFFGLNRVFSVEPVVIVIYLLPAQRVLFCAIGSLIKLRLSTLIFLFSYESIALFGNILRQGFAVFVFCMFHPWKGKSKMRFLDR